MKSEKDLVVAKVPEHAFKSNSHQRFGVGGLTTKLVLESINSTVSDHCYLDAR